MSKKKRKIVKPLSAVEEYKLFTAKWDRLKEECRLANTSLADFKISSLKSERITKRAVRNHNKNKRKKTVKKEKKSKIIPSAAELMIGTYLKGSNIHFKTEHIFESCINPKTKQPLRFDFFIPHMNTCIEYDGKHHFSYVPEIHGNDPKKAEIMIRNQRHRDNIKTIFCKEKAIRLIRLNNTHYYKIAETLREQLQCIHTTA